LLDGGEPVDVYKLNYRRCNQVGNLKYRKIQKRSFKKYNFVLESPLKTIRNRDSRIKDCNRNIWLLTVFSMSSNKVKSVRDLSK